MREPARKSATERDAERVAGEKSRQPFEVCRFVAAYVEVPLERTMAGALGAFQGQWGTNIPLLCAGSLLILAPSIILFLLFQKQFVAALLQGAVKG